MEDAISLSRSIQQEWQATECASNSWDEASERALVEAAKLDSAAFGRIYQQYLPRIYRYLRLRLGSEDDAADITQQVFLQALAALPGYREKGLPFAAWLFRIARNAALNANQRHRIAFNWDVLTDISLAPDKQTEEDELNPEAMVLKRETVSQLSALLAELDAAKLELLVLRFAAGLTVRQISQVVGKSEAAIHKQISRTLRVLRVQFREKYNEE
jgi:RNA polymerase sigma-70 factor, ECF subfamily